MSKTSFQLYSRSFQLYSRVSNFIPQIQILLRLFCAAGEFADERKEGQVHRDDDGADGYAEEGD